MPEGDQVRAAPGAPPTSRIPIVDPPPPQATQKSLDAASWLLAALLWVATTGAAQAAIAVDAVSASKAINATSVTFSHAVGSGTDRLLVVGVGIRRTRTVTSITFGGVALTKIRADQSTAFTGQCTSEIWYLVNPSTSTADVVITHDGSASFAVYGMAISFTGVDQSNPIEANAGAAGNSTGTQGVSVTTVSANAWVVDTILRDDDTPALVVGSGQTEHMNQNDTTNSNSSSGGSTEGAVASPGAVAMEWDIGATTQEFAISAAALKPKRRRIILVQ